MEAVLAMAANIAAIGEAKKLKKVKKGAGFILRQRALRQIFTILKGVKA